MDFLHIPCDGDGVTHGRANRRDRDRIFRALLLCEDPVAIRHGDHCHVRILANPRAKDEGRPLNALATHAFQTLVYGDAIAPGVSSRDWEEHAHAPCADHPRVTR